MTSTVLLEPIAVQIARSGAVPFPNPIGVPAVGGESSE